MLSPMAVHRTSPPTPTMIIRPAQHGVEATSDIFVGDAVHDDQANAPRITAKVGT
jgi:hypothetical protein